MTDVWQLEVDDALWLVKQAGLSMDDFVFSQTSAACTDAGAYPETYRVTVTRESTQRSQTYEGGRGRSWVADFDEHLKIKAFG